MSIVAECPHCESRFHLQPDLIGKAMRCPNPACREPFVVAEAKPRSKKPAGVPNPTHASGAVGDLMPVVEAEAVKPPRRSRSKSVSPPTDLPPIFDAEVVEEPVVVDAVLASPPRPQEPEIVEAVVVKPPPVREVVWQPDADVPAPVVPETRRAVRAEAAGDDDTIVRRRKKKNRAPIILIGLISTVLLLGGAIALYVLQIQTKSEAKQAQEAEELYKTGEYAKAVKAYEKLAADYPGSSDIDKYQFFTDLSSMRVAVWSVSSTDDPRVPMDKLKAFIEARKASPYAKPTAFGHDVFDAGKKVLEDVVSYAKDCVKAYRSDRTKLDELRKAEEMLAAGRDFLPLISPFRTKEDASLDVLSEPLAKSKTEIDRERKRLEILTQIRDVLKSPTDQAMQDAKGLLSAYGLAEDAEGVELIRAAEGDFLRRIVYEREPAAAQPLPASAAASLLFVARVGPTKAVVRGPDDLPAVFLAIARGILYALDEDSGELLWAARVGPDAFDPPAVARVALAEGPTDLAIVASNVAGQPAISAFNLRSGQPKWSQPLAAPVAGAAAIIGSRAYVPIRDASGSVLVFDLTTGMKIGRIAIGQPVGPGAIARPGTRYLYLAAESRRVYVFDTDAGLAGGDPQCVRVIPTDHLPGTLRTLPVILGQPGEDPSPRFLVLSQADGPDAMKLRAFPLPTNPTQGPDAPPVLELITALELALTGWASYPPVSDGERLAAVTDRGQVRLFGINQPGNKDAALFPLPSPVLSEPAKGDAVPGLVVPAEEGAYWVLVGGSLLKFRFTLLPDRGLSLVPAGAGLPVGIPTQPAQLNSRRDTACFVVRSANSSGCRAVSVRLQDGEPRWQRQLGIIPVTAPVRTESGFLLVDEDGGAVAIPTAGVAIPPVATKASPEWTAADPVDGATGPTRVAIAADGKTIFTVTPTGAGATAKWVIRRAANGKFDHTGSVTAPAALAGQPAVLNGTLLLPSADGFIYRLVLGDGKLKPDTLTPGPKWLDKRNASDAAAVCFIMPIADDKFLASDGGKFLKRWTWPAGVGFVDSDMKWELRDRIAVAPLLLPAAAGRSARFLAADATGGIGLYALDRGDAPLRRWVPGKTTALPGGKIATPFAMQTDSTGRQLVAYVVGEKKIVCLNVDADEPRWVSTAGDDAGGSIVGSPGPAGDGRWLITDLAGRVSRLDAETGQPSLTREVGLAGAVPATAGVPVGDNRVLVPLSDGSAAVVELPTPKEKE